MNQDEQIMDGMLRWDPGTLSTKIIERILTDAMADLWRDCYRRDSSLSNRRMMFREKLTDLIYLATGENMGVTS